MKKSKPAAKTRPVPPAKGKPHTPPVPVKGARRVPKER
jgi:hypothetical protein